MGGVSRGWIRPKLPHRIGRVDTKLRGGSEHGRRVWGAWDALGYLDSTTERRYGWIGGSGGAHLRAGSGDR